MGVDKLTDWRQVWGSSEEDTLAGQLRYEGGDMHARAKANLAQLNPSDFRLRPTVPATEPVPTAKTWGRTSTWSDPAKHTSAGSRRPNTRSGRKKLAN